MKNNRLCLAIAAACAWLAASAATYRNPILCLDFSDPDVCRGGDGRFYLTASSFGSLPGLPVLVSDDLVNWQYAGYALDRHPFETHGPEHGKSVWAPSIRYRADRDEYVIYWGDSERGAYRAAAKRPEGPWSEPRLVVPGKGLIDTCPLYDDDGRIYLVNAWAASRSGMNSVLTVRELDRDETREVAAPVMVYDGIPSGNFTAEGPKFYKRNGEYWLMFPAGGVPRGWQVAARSKSPYGPYEARTVMAQGKSRTNGPHQGGWVRIGDPDADGKDGSDWFVHFSDRGAYGRVVCLQPMKWRNDGWPVIGNDDDGDGCGEPVDEWTMPSSGSIGVQKIYPQTSDEFDGLRPGPQWQWLGRGADFAGWGTPYGFYRLYSTPYATNHWNSPNLMVQKFPAFNFSAAMKARVGAKETGEEAGIVVQGRDYARLGLRFAGKGFFDIVYVECQGADAGKPERTETLGSVSAEVIGAGLRAANMKDVWLRVEVRQGETPPKGLCGAAICSFAYSLDGAHWNDAPSRFTAREGKWIGATVGIYSLSRPECKDRGWIDADWFRIAR